MTPTEIRIELMRRKSSISKIGRKLQVTPTAVHRVIERNSTSERIMIAVAEEICVPPHMAFPEHQFKI